MTEEEEASLPCKLHGCREQRRGIEEERNGAKTREGKKVIRHKAQQTIEPNGQSGCKTGIQTSRDALNVFMTSLSLPPFLSVVCLRESKMVCLPDDRSERPLATYCFEGGVRKGW